MRITNKTKWNTAQLRAFVARCAAEELDAAKRKVASVEFLNAGKRTEYVRGQAEVGGRKSWIWLPRTAIRKSELAMVISHEFAHLRGLGRTAAGERAMRASESYGYRGGDYKTRYAWAEELPLELVAPPAPPTADELAIRRNAKTEANAARVRKLIAKWETKKRRADNALKKYRRSLKRYEAKIQCAAIRK